MVAVAKATTVDEVMWMVSKRKLKQVKSCFGHVKFKWNADLFLLNCFRQSGKQESSTFEMEGAKRPEKKSWRAWEGQKETISCCSCWTWSCSSQELCIETSTGRKLSSVRASNCLFDVYES